MINLKNPVVALFIRISIAELFIMLLLALWVPPDAGAELGFLIIMMAFFGLNLIAAIIFFFLHKEIIWKAWLVLALISPFYYMLFNKILMLIKHPAF